MQATNGNPMTQHTRALTTGQVSALLRNVLHGDQTATEVLNMVATAYRALVERCKQLENIQICRENDLMDRGVAIHRLQQQLADAQARYTENNETWAKMVVGLQVHADTLAQQNATLRERIAELTITVNQQDKLISWHYCSQ